MKQIIMIGEGAWATAISQLLTENGHSVTMICQNESTIEEINHNQTNKRYAPHLAQIAWKALSLHNIDKNIPYDYVFQAIPVTFLRTTLTQYAAYANIKNTHWCSLSKGIDSSGKTASQIIAEVINPTEISVLSGPSFARCVIDHDPTQVMLGNTASPSNKGLIHTLNNACFQVKSSSDTIGIELLGALKNIYALGFGMLEGLEYQDNAKALFLTHSITEMGIIITSFGCSKETTYGLAGIGDLLLTCNGNKSKNKTFGKNLALERKYSLIMNSDEYICEGITTLKHMFHRLQEQNLKTPIIHHLYKIVYEHKNIKNEIHLLLHTL